MEMFSSNFRSAQSNNCVILFTGKLLKTITRESFMVRSYVYDIAVYNGGNMFLACRDGLRKYTLKY